jgi:hypothetical protein
MLGIKCQLMFWSVTTYGIQYYPIINDISTYCMKMNGH